MLVLPSHDECEPARRCKRLPLLAASYRFCATAMGFGHAVRAASAGEDQPLAAAAAQPASTVAEFAQVGAMLAKTLPSARQHLR